MEERLTEDLRRFTGGKAWISKRKLRTWLGYGDAKLSAFLDGMAFRINGNRVEYFIGDVAKRCAEEIASKEVI